MSTPLPIFSKMPWPVKQLIVKSTDTPTKLELISCSKELKNHVTTAKVTYYQLYLQYILYDRIHVSLRRTCQEEEHVDFVRESDDGYVKKCGDGKKFLESGDFIEAAVEQFMKILKDPSIKLSNLTVTLKNHKSRFFKWHLMKKLKESLGNLTHRIPVDSFYIETSGNSGDVKVLLSHLEPGTLRSITLLTPGADLGADEVGTPTIDLSEIGELEQWKQARYARVSMFSSGIGPEGSEHFRVYSSQLENLDLYEVENILQGIRQKGWMERSIKYENLAWEVECYLLQFQKTEKWDVLVFALDVCEEEKTQLFVSLEPKINTITFFSRSLKSCY